MVRKPGGLLRLMRPPTLNPFFPNLELRTCVRVIWGAFIQGPVPGKGTKAPKIKYLEEFRVMLSLFQSSMKPVLSRYFPIYF